MEISKVSSVSFRADSAPAVSTGNVALEAAPEEKKSHTGLIVGGAVLAAALAGYAIYTHKNPKAAADAAGDAAGEAGKKAKEAVVATVDDLTKNIKAFWAKHKFAVGKKVDAGEGFEGYKVTTSKVKLGGKKVFVAEVANKDGKTISRAFADSKGQTLGIMTFDDQTRTISSTIQGMETKVSYDGKDQITKLVIGDKDNAKVYNVGYSENGTMVSIATGGKSKSSLAVKLDEEGKATEIIIGKNGKKQTTKFDAKNFDDVKAQYDKSADAFNKFSNGLVAMAAAKDSTGYKAALKTFADADKELAAIL